MFEVQILRIPREEEGFAAFVEDGDAPGGNDPIFFQHLIQVTRVPGSPGFPVFLSVLPKDVDEVTGNIGLLRDLLLPDIPGEFGQYPRKDPGRLAVFDTACPQQPPGGGEKTSRDVKQRLVGTVANTADDGII